MGTAERRSELVRLLCRRRHETVGNFAAHFGVSERTIRRDIEALSATVPIYTRPGQYGGGVYIMDGYSPDRMYMSETELTVLRKMLDASKAGHSPALSQEEIHILSKIIENYTKPAVEKEK